MKAQLADAIIKSPWRRWNDTFDGLARMLERPFDPNHAPRHPALAPVMAQDVDNHVHVYVIEDHTAHTIRAMFSSPRRCKLLFKMLRPPHQRMFCEFYDQLYDRRCGVFAFNRGDDNFDFSVVVRERDAVPAMPICVFKTKLTRDIDDPQFDWSTQFFVMPPHKDFDHYRSMFGANFTKGDETAVARIVLHVLGLWALMAIQGATVTSRTVSREGRIARKRGKLHAMGAVDSYNVVRMNLPAGHYARNPEHFQSGPGVRYHTVRQHPRWILHAGAQMMTWVREHHRGNPALGVVIKDTHVKARGAS